MALTNFDQAVTQVLEAEGGFVNNPNDAGKATNFGITLAILKEYRKKDVTVEDVKNLKVEEAKAIYKSVFWDPMKLDQIQSLKLAKTLFNLCVNMGPSQASKFLQRALKVKDDGVIGPKTIAAANGLPESKACLEVIKQAQIFYIHLVENKPSQITFLEGWINRTHELLNIVFS